MKKEELKKLIDTAAGRIPADVVIKNCKIVNVFSGTITEGDIALCGGQIAGIGDSTLSRVTDPALTTVHLHFEEAGREAAQLLTELMEKGKDAVQKEVKLDSRLIVQESTRRRDGTL